MKKPQLPVAYYQIKKIKEFWMKSEYKTKEIINEFNISLKEIEETYLYQLEMWEEKQELTA